MSIRKNLVLSVAGLALAFAMTGTANAQTGSWSAPSGAPPTANVAAPINVGSASQTKTGLFRVNGGFYSQGVSLFENRVEIGIDPCYGVSSGAGCTGSAGGGGAAGASADPAHVASGSLIQRIAGMFIPKSAMAVGTPSTDKLHVYGNASFVGALTVNGKDVCLEDGTNCGSSGQWTTSGTNIYRNTGKVGVGLTTVPAGKLEIRDGAAQLVLGQSDSNRWKLWGGSNLHFRKADDTDVFFLGSDGKVGVGTTSPSAKFTVAGDGKIGNVELVDNQGGSIELGAGGSSTTPYIDFRGNGSAGGDFNARIINNGNGQLSFQNAGGEKMKVVNTSQSVVVANSVPVYLDLCQTGGKVSMNSSTGCGTNTLLGYLLPPPPSSGSSLPAPTVVNNGTSGYLHHAVGSTSIVIDYNGKFSGGYIEYRGVEVKNASTGTYLSGHQPYSTSTYTGAPLNITGIDVPFTVSSSTTQCGVNYQWRAWAKNASGIGYAPWATYFVAC